MKKYVDRGIVKWAPFDSVMDSQEATWDADKQKEVDDWSYEESHDDDW
jgi:hypothetical protein